MPIVRTGILSERWKETPRSHEASMNDQTKPVSRLASLPALSACEA